MKTGVYYDRSRRKYMYLPEPFDAEDCEAVAGGLAWNDTWGKELLEAADEIRRLEGEKVEGPGVRVVVVLER